MGFPKRRWRLKFILLDCQLKAGPQNAGEIGATQQATAGFQVSEVCLEVWLELWKAEEESREPGTEQKFLLIFSDCRCHKMNSACWKAEGDSTAQVRFRSQLSNYSFLRLRKSMKQFPRDLDF